MKISSLIPLALALVVAVSGNVAFAKHSGRQVASEYMKAGHSKSHKSNKKKDKKKQASVSKQKRNVASAKHKKVKAKKKKSKKRY